MNNKEDLSKSRIESVFNSNRDIKIEEFINLNLSCRMLTKIECLIRFNLKNLTHLDLSSNHIEKIEGLENLKKLEYLNLGGNKITKIENLDNLENLTHLDLSCNHIKKIEGLKNLKNLRTLIFGDAYHYSCGNEIEVIENIDHLTELDHLNLSMNKITEITGLEKLIYLVYLILSCNHISEIKGLSNNPILTDIDLSSNRIKVVEGLKDVKYLKDLDLTGNPIESIESFDEINGISCLKINPLNIPEKLKPLVKQHFSYWGDDSFNLRRDLYSHKGITFNPEKEW